MAHESEDGIPEQTRNFRAPEPDDTIARDQYSEEVRGPLPEPPTEQELLEMTDEQFDAYSKRVNRQLNWARLVDVSEDNIEHKKLVITLQERQEMNRIEGQRREELGSREHGGDES